MGSYPSDATETADNGKDCNAWKFGFTPKSELWNCPLAMIVLFFTEFMLSMATL
ncbi:hypothetical protein [Nodularia sphaerocarpa]|uniref:hypothetical protein n=1 Tax=Nodularia sphaerocarpa TaxID=137816 RepID=UPI003A91BE3A|nr:hypothetical protein BDGGKGIB_03777 [Nodularia sphaerocarpa UHCC 0038]